MKPSIIPIGLFVVIRILPGYRSGKVLAQLLDVGFDVFFAFAADDSRGDHFVAGLAGVLDDNAHPLQPAARYEVVDLVLRDQGFPGDVLDRCPGVRAQILLHLQEPLFFLKMAFWTNIPRHPHDNGPAHAAGNELHIRTRHERLHFSSTVSAATTLRKVRRSFIQYA